MAKAVKKAWVRYDDGSETGKERYELLIWDEEIGGWHLAMSSRFVADAENPDAGKNYVSYEIVTEICRLSRLGYIVEI